MVTTTYYPTKFYNTDNAPTPKITKHIFANTQDIATMEGSGAAAKIYYATTDLLNSSTVMTDGVGAIAETMDYFPFGGIRIDQKTSAFSEQRKFIGEEFDADTGLNYLNARYYNSNLGRFISQDPMFWSLPKELLSDPQQLNSYSYARNNPLSFIDSSGEKAEWVVRQIPPVYSISVPYLGTLGIVPSFGAHSFIKITPELGVNFSQYGDTNHYAIGGYPSNGKAWGGQLQAKINEPFDFNISQSQELATYPLKVPDGMSISQYDKKLLESGTNLASSNLGDYFFTGQPIKNTPNSGNVAAQAVINAGGTIPELQSVYYGNSLYGSHTPYFPLGSGVALGTPSYAQQAATAVKNTVVSATSKVTSNISATFDAIKSKLQK